MQQKLTPVQQRLVAKLPATATGGKLTRPERSQLAVLERMGVIRYIDQSGYWVRVQCGRPVGGQLDVPCVKEDGHKGMCEAVGAGRCPECGQFEGDHGCVTVGCVKFSQ